MKIGKVLLFVLAVAVAGVLGTGGAMAQQATCSVGSVNWSENGTLEVVCGGTVYRASGSGTGACAIDMDARRAWRSLAEAALLAKKKLYLEHTACTGGPGLTFVRLTPQS